MTHESGEEGDETDKVDAAVDENAVTEDCAVPTDGEKIKTLGITDGKIIRHFSFRFLS